MAKPPPSQNLPTLRIDPNADLRDDITRLEKELANRRAQKIRELQTESDKQQIHEQWPQKKRDLEISLYERANAIEKEHPENTRLEALIAAANEAIEDLKTKKNSITKTSESEEVGNYGYDIISNFWQDLLLTLYREQEKEKRERDRLDTEEARRIAIESRLRQMRDEFAHKQQEYHSKILSEVKKANTDSKQSLTDLLEWLERAAGEGKP